MKKKFRNQSKNKTFDFLRYLGPGLLVTVGFIDPGNWASNIAAGSGFGYELLWMVTLSTIMLIILQHNAAHLGIATGLCLSEAASRYIQRLLKNIILLSAMLAAVATAMAEMLGGAIALQMLFRIPIKIGSMLILAVSLLCAFTNAYKRIEKLIIIFVSLIGFSFLFEIGIAKIDWGAAAVGWVKPSFPAGSMPVILSVLGAVVMPHNLFLHSEIIQSRQWNLEDDSVIKQQLKYEFKDTLFSMIIGWAINSAMILMAAATLYQGGNGRQIDDLTVAGKMLSPLMGNAATVVFALALLLAGISSSITAGMAGGTIFSGIFNQPYDMKTKETKAGILLTMILAAVVILFISQPFKGLIYSIISKPSTPGSIISSKIRSKVSFSISSMAFMPSCTLLQKYPAADRFRSIRSQIGFSSSTINIFIIMSATPNRHGSSSPVPPEYPPPYIHNFL